MAPYPVVRRHGAHFSIIPASLWRLLRGPAVYVMAYDPGDHVVTPLYVGETEQLRGYIGPTHLKWQDALVRGMNVVCVHIEPRGEQLRRNLERVLRERYKPPLNQEPTPADTAYGDLVDAEDRKVLSALQDGRHQSTSCKGTRKRF